MFDSIPVKALVMKRGGLLIRAFMQVISQNMEEPLADEVAQNMLWVASEASAGKGRYLALGLRESRPG